LPDPLGPESMQVKGCLNLISLLITE